MNRATHLEHRASSSQSKHEGEPSFALCDRLDRTRANSQRQLPTDHDYAVPTREYQTDQSSLNMPRLLLALYSEKGKDNYNPTDPAELTRSLHIRATHSSRSAWKTKRARSRRRVARALTITDEAAIRSGKQTSNLHPNRPGKCQG
jgi:hypothetical protein